MEKKKRLQVFKFPQRNPQKRYVQMYFSSTRSSGEMITGLLNTELEAVRWPPCSPPPTRCQKTISGNSKPSESENQPKTTTKKTSRSSSLRRIQRRRIHRRRIHRRRIQRRRIQRRRIQRRRICRTKATVTKQLSRGEITRPRYRTTRAWRREDSSRYYENVDNDLRKCRQRPTGNKRNLQKPVTRGYNRKSQVENDRRILAVPLCLHAGEKYSRPRSIWCKREGDAAGTRDPNQVPHGSDRSNSGHSTRGSQYRNKGPVHNIGIRERERDYLRFFWCETVDEENEEILRIRVGASTLRLHQLGISARGDTIRFHLNTSKNARRATFIRRWFCHGRRIQESRYAHTQMAI